jgi:hypothetical protein
MTQKEQVLAMLRTGPKRTADFCVAAGLAAEWRRAMTELRRAGHIIIARRIRQGSWEFTLAVDAEKQSAPSDQFKLGGPARLQDQPGGHTPQTSLRFKARRSQTFHAVVPPHQVLMPEMDGNRPTGRIQFTVVADGALAESLPCDMPTVCQITLRP